MINISDDDSMDALFKEALEEFEKCRQRVNKITDRRQKGVGVRTPTPTIETDTVNRDVLSQGEGSRQVRAHRGLTHQVFPLYLYSGNASGAWHMLL